MVADIFLKNFFIYHLRRNQPVILCVPFTLSGFVLMYLLLMLSFSDSIEV